MTAVAENSISGKYPFCYVSMEKFFIYECDEICNEEVLTVLSDLKLSTVASTQLK